MIPEEQVCNMPQSRRLYDAGIRLSSMCWWRNDYPNNPDVYTNKWYLIFDDDYPYTGEHKAVKYKKGFHLLPAFTVAELGVLLDQYGFEQMGMTVTHATIERKFRSIGGNYSEAENRADMLIYLLEERLILADDLNELWK